MLARSAASKVFFYVRPVGGRENTSSSKGENPSINNMV